MNEQVIEAIRAIEAAFSAPPATPPSWDSFEKALASSLTVLDEEFLVLSTRGGNRFVQFAVDPALGIFAETVSNAYLGPDEKLDAGQLADLLSMGWAAPTHAPDSPDPVPMPDGSPNHFREFKRPFSCAEVAAFAVRTLTGPLRVGSPAELEYRASDEAGHTVTLPALELAREDRPRPKASPPAKSKGTSPFEKLRSRLLAAARTLSGQAALDYEKDGSLQVPIGPRTGWIRPYENPCFVRVYVHLLGEVEPDDEFVGLIHQLNSRIPIARAIYVDKCVFLGIDFPALPFRAEHLTQAVTLLAQFADKAAEDLGQPGDAPKTAS